MKGIKKYKIKKQNNMHTRFIIRTILYEQRGSNLPKNKEQAKNS